MFRVVSYNTRGSLGMDGRRDTPRIAGVVRNLTPDVACFQEIHKRIPVSGCENQPESLERLLGRSFVFQPNVVFPIGEYGIGIASQWQVESVSRHMLPSVREPRGVLEVQYLGAVDGGRISVYCTHWGLNEQERMLQAEALAGLLSRARSPVVVCGDLNERPSGSAVAHLLATTTLQDAGAASNEPTFPSDPPTARIDYILHSSDLRCARFEVVCSPASDHCVIVGDFVRNECFT